MSLGSQPVHSAWFIRIVVAVLAAGVGLHASRGVLGNDLLLAGFLILAASVTLIAVGMWIFRGLVQAHGGWQRSLYVPIAVFFALSLPIHLSTYLTQRTDLLRAFPDWFGMLVTAVQLAMAIGLWRTSPRQRADASTCGLQRRRAGLRRS